MRPLLLLLFIVFALYSKAQSVEMLPLGSSQTGFFIQHFAVAQGYRSLFVSAIDTIQGKPAKRLTSDYSLGPAPRWIYQSGDSIFGHNGPPTNWYFLFKNNFTLGEITTIKFKSAEIIAIDTVLVGSVSMRRFKISFLSTNSQYRYIYDRAGPENGFLDWCGVPCDESAFWMCAYEDNDIAPTTLPNNFCNLYLPTTTLNTIEQPKLYPNPSSGELNLYFGAGNLPEEVSISDLNGKILHQTSINSHAVQMDIAPLPKGVYLVKTGTYVFKLVKI